MTKVIELTQRVEEATINYGNAMGLIEIETARQILITLREELNHELRKEMR